MFRCGAKCCDDTSSSVEEIQRCIERCAEPLSKSQTFIQNEMQNFQVDFHPMSLNIICLDFYEELKNEKYLERGNLYLHEGNIKICKLT